MNRAVGKKEIGGFALKIKTVSGVYKGTIYTSDGNTTYDIESEMKIYFDLSSVDIDFTIGQFYKVQLAYIDNYGAVGYYSTVGVTKYTTKPRVYIDGLTFGTINPHSYYYTGVYSQQDSSGNIGDTTEKMYSSQFKVYDEDGNVLADSGEILHNTSEDNLSYEQNETFTLTQDLDLDKSYYIVFSVTTSNNLVPGDISTVTTSRYRIMQRRSIEAEINATLQAELDYDNGLIQLSLVDEIDDVVSGTFLISRACSKDGYAWEEFRRFDLQSMIPDKWSLTDCTIEQGLNYKYSLQQYNSNNVYSDRIVSNTVLADFEDAFLYDGEKQLKLQFNPKVSTFKTDLLETKTETIGSKHPFITRNGHVNYKELAISGLISYKMDDSELFVAKEDIGLDEETFDLTSENIAAERLFKIKVMEWLTDGNPKIFRSPTEGNFIVRLLNVSYSPEDTLGRMLHNFSATAYEIADFNTTNLEYYGLIDPTENLSTQTRWSSIQLKDLGFEEISLDENSYKADTYYIKNKSTGQYYISKDEYSDIETYYQRIYTDAEENPTIITISLPSVYSISFTDMMPGSLIYIGTVAKREEIMIGNTGAYIYDSTTPLTSIGIDSRYINQGLFTYTYQTKAATIFGTITQTSIVDVPIYQIIGNTTLSDNILTSLEDIRTEVLKYYFMRFSKREVRYLYVDQDINKNTNLNYLTYYSDMDKTTQVFLSDLDKNAIYRLRHTRTDYRDITGEGYYVDANSETFAPLMDYGIDLLYDTVSPIEWTDKLFQIKLNNEAIDLNHTDSYYLSETDSITSVSPGLGIITELSYTKQIKSYSFEEDESTFLYSAKQAYETRLQNYLNHRAALTFTSDYDKVEVTEKNKLKQSYNTYIELLTNAINEYKEANGIE